MPDAYLEVVPTPIPSVKNPITPTGEIYVVPVTGQQGPQGGQGQTGQTGPPVDLNVVVNEATEDVLDALETGIDLSVLYNNAKA